MGRAGDEFVLELIEQPADRIEVLKSLLDAEMSKPEVAAHRVCELAGEIRQAEAAIAKMREVTPTGTGTYATPKQFGTDGVRMYQKASAFGSASVGPQWVRSSFSGSSRRPTVPTP